MKTINFTRKNVLNVINGNQNFLNCKVNQSKSVNNNK